MLAMSLQRATTAVLGVLLLVATPGTSLTGQRESSLDARLWLNAAAISSQIAPEVTGTWQGSWGSVTGMGGSLSASLRQTAGLLSGAVSVTGSPCFANGQLSGSINGNATSFGGLFGADQKVKFNATIDAAGNSMTGNYTVAGGACDGDFGSWSLVRAAQKEQWEELNTRVLALLRQGKYAEGTRVAQEALRLAETTFGPQHPAVATSQNNLAEFYVAQGQYEDAEVLYQHALRSMEKAFGPESPHLAVTLKNLAGLYIVRGDYASAEAAIRRAVDIEQKALGPEHPTLARSLSTLAAAYAVQGNYAAAEPLLQRALRIQEKVLGPEHPDVAQSLSTLAATYQQRGNYAAATPLLQRALNIREKVLGPEHPDVAESLNSLAVLFNSQGQRAAAEPFFQRALAIREKVLGPGHPAVAQSLNDLAQVYVALGNYAAAEPLLRRSVRIGEVALRTADPRLAIWLNNLALFYLAQGQYAAAEPLCQRALSILEKALGPEHPSVGAGLGDLALLYYARGLPGQAESSFDRSLLNLSGQFEQHFAYMSEKERLLFLDKVWAIFPVYSSFCLTYKDRNPALIGKLYDVLLWQKGFVARSIAAVRTHIESSGDKEALALLERLTTKKTQLATLLLANKPSDRAQWRKTVERLKQEANEIEGELVKRSTVLAEGKRLAHVTWREVRNGLRKDEAAVEFVRFPFHDGKRWTDTTYYAALIVTPESKEAPTLVLLGEGEKLERAPMVEYRDRVDVRGVSATVVTITFYEAFWKPLETVLARANRIYLSPDGALNHVSFGIVPAEDGRLLIEKYDLHVVSSTADILRERRPTSAGAAVLIGNPRFGLEEAQQRDVATTLRKAEGSKPSSAAVGSGLRSRDQRGSGLPSLPGTKLEVESVASLLKKRQWQVEVHTGEEALEETVKAAKSPRILHIATHGFFLPDEKETRRNAPGDLPSGREDPMLRSGLYFAGANRVLSGASPPLDLEDGVLTAYEAMGLNLQGTELVVLSACKTGLGRVSNGEGVFGLRRALQVSGAEAVLMSLWSVPDQETQELMTLFYAKWLSGKSKHEALREAQLELRAKIKERDGQDLPFYWGGFVLVGR